MVRRRRPSPLLLAVLGVVSLLGCSSPDRPGDSAASASSSATSTTPSDGPGSAPAPPPDLKPYLVGVLDRQGAPRPGLVDRVDGFVVNIAWADVQAEPFGPLLSPNPIDEAIDFVRREAPHLRLKLRVNAGRFAPESVQSIGGSPVPISYDGDFGAGHEGTVGRFWLPEFGDAYEDLQRRLAEAYDDVPEIGQVVVTRCMTIHAEPLLRQLGTPETPEALLEAGYTTAADRRCHEEALAAHDVWQRTPSSMAFNPYHDLEAGGGGTADAAVALEVMDECRQALGARCVLENYSLAWPLREGEEGNYDAIYDGLVARGGPLSFQTATADRVGDWEAALLWAADVGALSVELNRGYPDYDVDTLRLAADALRANG